MNNVNFFAPEFNGSIHLREKGIIVSHADIEAGMELGPALAHQNRSCFGELTAVKFYAAILRITVPPVS